MRQEVKLVYMDSTYTTCFGVFKKFFTISILAIGDVFWDQTNLFLMFVRPLNPLQSKKSFLKKMIFLIFLAHTENCIKSFKVISKGLCSQVKK